LDQARTLDQLADRFEVLPLAQAAAAAFPVRNLSADEARRLANGGRLAAIDGDAARGDAGRGDAGRGDAGRGDEGAGRGQVPDPRAPTAAYAPDGTLVALVTEESGQARPLVVFA
jgi:tRNA pseudouridine55 synthase